MSSISKFEKSAKEFNDKKLNFFSTNKQTPYYSSGGRTLIRVGGRDILVAKSIRWNVSYTATPLHTIDSQFPWDIDVGQGIVRASISQFVDPTRGLEADHLFNTMASSAHQPLVELQVLDSTGAAVFFAKGMFTDMSGEISKGNLSTFTTSFIGIQYQHFVSQNFKPYSGIASSISKFTKGLQGLVGGATGGLL